MATVFTYRFIKESNGNVIIQWLRNGQPFQRFSVQPGKDIRVSLTANGQVIIPIDNNGGVAGEATLAVPFERIDFVNSVPSSANPASPDEAVQRLGEDFFYSNSGGTGGGVISVTGDGVDNTDPANPVISFPTPAEIGAPSGSGNSTGTNTGDQDLSGLQPLLVSGTNIKTINGDSLLGSGNIVISGNDDLLPFDSTLISITGTTSAVIYKEVEMPADIGDCALRFTCFARSITQITGNNIHQVRLGTTFAGATTISQGALFTTGVAQIQNTIAIVGGASGKLTYPQNNNTPFDFVAGRPYFQINVDWTAGQKLYFAVFPANTGNVIEVFGVGIEKV